MDAFFASFVRPIRSAYVANNMKFKYLSVNTQEEQKTLYSELKYATTIYIWGEDM